MSHPTPLRPYLGPIRAAHRSRGHENFIEYLNRCRPALVGSAAAGLVAAALVSGLRHGGDILAFSGVEWVAFTLVSLGGLTGYAPRQLQWEVGAEGFRVRNEAPISLERDWILVRFEEIDTVDLQLARNFDRFESYRSTSARLFVRSGPKTLYSETAIYRERDPSSREPILDFEVAMASNPRSPLRMIAAISSAWMAWRRERLVLATESSDPVGELEDVGRIPPPR